MIVGHAGTIASKIMGAGADLSSSGILGIIEGTIGQLESEKKLEIQAELDTLLAEAKIDEEDNKSPSFFRSGCRDSIEWGVGIVFIYHAALVEIANTCAWIHGGTINPLDTLTATILGGLLGIYGISKCTEKFNSNNSDNS